MFKLIARSLLVALTLSALALSVAGCLGPPDDEDVDALPGDLLLTTQALPVPFNPLGPLGQCGASQLTLGYKYDAGGFKPSGAGYGYFPPSVTFLVDMNPAPPGGVLSLGIDVGLLKPSGEQMSCWRGDYSGPGQPSCLVSLLGPTAGTYKARTSLLDYWLNGSHIECWYPFGYDWSSFTLP